MSKRLKLNEQSSQLDIVVSKQDLNMNDQSNRYTVKALKWSKDAPVCHCGQRVIYICNLKDCHLDGQELYCLRCLEN